MKITNTHLVSQSRFARTADLVARLETAIASGMVPNVLYNDAKFVLNRAVEKAAEDFLNTGPHEQKHNQSDWWLGAYEADAFVHGVTSLPTALKRAERRDLKEYAAFIKEMLPFHEMLQSAKPLIVKKGDMPKVKTVQQIAHDAERMTCQCCSMKYLARLGTVAHHGYERPGTGWQTASCMGAKFLPFENDHARLDLLIESLDQRIKALKKNYRDTKSEVIEVQVSITDYSKERQAGRDRPSKTLSFTRRSFKKVTEADEHTKRGFGELRYYTFDDCKKRQMETLAGNIKRTEEWKADRDAFRKTWKHTHNYDRATKAWVKK